MLRLAVIADDLTGANDTGVQFRKNGLHTMVLIDSLQQKNITQDIDIVVLDTDSRAVSASVASARVARVCEMLRDQGILHVYKKIDSTLRGNISAEIAAAWVELEPSITIIAPAYPKTDRVTVGGYQLLKGVPIGLTEIAHDPKTPVAEAWIPKLLGSDCSQRIGTVPLQTVMDGKDAIHNELIKQLTLGKDWVVVDAVTETNLYDIVEAASTFERVLWVGSAGLAEQIPASFQWAENSKVVSVSCNSVVVVAGSVSALTQKQIQAYVNKTGAANFVVDSIAAVFAPSVEAERIITQVTAIWKRQDIVISCSNDRGVVEKVKEAAKSAGMTAADAGVRIASVLGLVVVELAKQGVDGLFLTGGETAISCCRALGATGIEILAEVIPGIPLGQLNGGPFHGMAVITKAGAFGGTDAIIEAVGALKYPK